jgi:hypothetical protein
MSLKNLFGKQHFSIRDFYYYNFVRRDKFRGDLSLLLREFKDFENYCKELPKNFFSSLLYNTKKRMFLVKLANHSRIFVYELTLKGDFISSYKIRTIITSYLLSHVRALSMELALRTQIEASTSNYIDLKFKLALFNSKRYNFYRKIFSLRSGQALTRKQTWFHNNCFSDLVNGKLIALVGPGHIQKQDLNFIKEVDVLVFLNHQTFDDTYRELADFSKGKKIISYFSGGRHLEIEQSEFEKIITLVDFGVFSERKIKRKLPDKLKKKTKGLRNNEILVEYGYWNFAQYALMDLIEYYPLEVKIIGIDLFTQSQPYSDNYVKYAKQSLVDDIRRHDPITQFKFLHFLWKRRIISPSDTLIKILENEKKYINIMQNLYGSND